MKSRMYSDVLTWNPFKGCLFDCVYCKPSFQAQAKRQKHNCIDCYNYVPHEHPERLNKIPSAGTIFTCGNGDICFSRPEFTRQIIESVRQHPKKTFYLQSKRPAYFRQFIKELPSNVILLTTLETKRDEGYQDISKAPMASIRYQQLKDLNYHRKVVTIEPIMDFDLEIFIDWIKSLNPEYVWIGFNSRPKQVRLPEPSEDKLLRFMIQLKSAGIEVNGKDLRSITVRGYGATFKESGWPTLSKPPASGE